MLGSLFRNKHNAQQTFLDLVYGNPYSPKDTMDSHAFRLSIGRKFADKFAILPPNGKYIPLRISKATLSVFIKN